MTPGFAKPRSALPWLPYGECSRVIINPHNFTPAAVNYGVPSGAQPIAAWTPSRDTAGNGTTTVTDFMGSSPGTLTNMDAATDWVADTGSGGVRALDFADTDDRVLATLLASMPAPYTISLWHYTRSYIATTMWLSSASQEFGINGSGQLILQRNNSYGQFANNGGVITYNQWQHAAVVMSAAKSVAYYRNGINTTTGNANMAALAVDFPAAIRIGSNGLSGRRFDGRLDDIRIFGSALGSSDLAYLATSRGVVS